MKDKLDKDDVLILSGSMGRKVRIDDNQDIEIKKQFRVWKSRTIHLRSAMDMEKAESWRTFCGLTGKVYSVTEYPELVTCKKCKKKLTEVLN